MSICCLMFARAGVSIYAKHTIFCLYYFFVYIIYKGKVTNKIRQQGISLGVNRRGMKTKGG